MIEIYNEELLEKAGLVAIRDDNSVTIYTLAELTNDFKVGDIIVKEGEKLDGHVECIICRYCGYDGTALLTDAFYIRFKDGTINKHNRYYPMIGLGYTSEYRLATEIEKSFFFSELKTATYIDY
jgi:hypothetical protein